MCIAISGDRDGRWLLQEHLVVREQRPLRQYASTDGYNIEIWKCRLVNPNCRQSDLLQLHQRE
jgi:hypothetical protein